MAESLENQSAPDEAVRSATRFRHDDSQGDDRRDVGQIEDVGQAQESSRSIMPFGHSSGDVAPGTENVAQDTGRADARAATKARNEFLDITKAVLIILVVLAHLVEHLGQHDRIFTAVYSALSLCGLPFFVFVSGMVAKPLLTDKDYRRMVAKLLLPLICLQPVYLALLQFAEHDAAHHILDPQWLLWFLLSLCMWRIMLPLFLRIPLALLVAIGMTLAAGYTQYIGADLSLSRTLYFFPFFIAGYLWRDAVPKLVARTRPLLWLLFALVMAGTFLWFMHGLDPAVVYHDRGYDRAAVWKAFPVPGRLVLLMLGGISCVTWMAMMPTKSKWLAHLGQRTLTILALHGFAVLVCYKIFNMVGWTASPSLLLFPVLVVLAVVIAWAVSLFDGPFNRFFDWLSARLSRLVPYREQPPAHSG